MGTVEFTGLAITRMLALGAWSAAALAKSRTMEALVLNKSVNKTFSNFETLTRYTEERITIASHSRFSGNTSGYKNNLGALKGSLQSLGTRVITSDLALSVDMRDISSNTCGCQLAI